MNLSIPKIHNELIHLPSLEYTKNCHRVERVKDYMHFILVLIYRMLHTGICINMNLPIIPEKLARD